MPTTTYPVRIGLALLAMAALVGVALASGASFAITGDGVQLGATKDDADPVRIPAKAELGKPFTLVAQGIVLPRGGTPQPGEPDAGSWTFDEKRFKRLQADGKSADKTKVIVRLEPTAVGASPVRFTGKILGYERTFEVVVDVADRKKE